MMGILILNLMEEAPVPFDISIIYEGVVHSTTHKQRDPNFVNPPPHCLKAGNDLKVKIFIHTTVLFFH